MKGKFFILTAVLILAASIAAEAQSKFTNSAGIWTFTASNGVATITQFQGFGNVSTGSNTDVTVPDSINGFSVTTIGQGAFAHDFMFLTSLSIPNSVTSIGASAFLECDFLTNVLIGAGLTSISNFAFNSDPNLTSVVFLGNAPVCGSEIYLGDPNAISYYLPTASGWTNTLGGNPAQIWNPIIPRLGIANYSNQPVLFFPMPAHPPISLGTNYVIQMNTDLSSTNWVNVTNAVSLICIQVTNAPNPAFFRIQPH